MTTPITPDVARKSLVIPGQLVEAINAEIQRNIGTSRRYLTETSLSDGGLSETEEIKKVYTGVSSQIDLDRCVQTINKGVPYDAQFKITPSTLEQIKELYRSYGWDVTATYDQTGRNEYTNHLLFVEL